MHLRKSMAAWAAAISNNLPFDGWGLLNSLIAVFFFVYVGIVLFWAFSCVFSNLAPVRDVLLWLSLFVVIAFISMRPSGSAGERKFASMRPKPVAAIGAAAGAMIGIILAITQGGIPGYAAGTFGAVQVVTPNGINFSAVIGPWGNEALIVCFGASLGWVCGLLAVKVLARVLAWRGSPTYQEVHSAMEEQKTPSSDVLEAVDAPNKSIDLSEKTVRGMIWKKCVSLFLAIIIGLSSFLGVGALYQPPTQTYNEPQMVLELIIDHVSPVVGHAPQAPAPESKSPQHQEQHADPKELRREMEEYETRSKTIHDFFDAILKFLKPIARRKHRKKGRDEN